MAAGDLQLPPGFRFHPTDDELVTHYLCRKCASQSIDVPIIAEIDLYKYDPWQLPGMALYGEKEWYFFSPRDRKYPNGSRPNRAAGHGYWKATGADKPIGRPKPIGIKKALVFYSGKAPKGEKTNWIMHEYRLADVDRSIRKKNNSLRLDDWVLCRVYNKKGAAIDRAPEPPHAGGHDVTSVLTTEDDTKPAILASVPETLPMVYEDFMHLISPTAAPHLPAAAHSSCSEHVLSPEVESAPNLGEWEATAFDFPFNYIDASSLMEQMSEVYASAYMTKPL